MKKTIKIILSLVITTALLCTTAFAATPRWKNVLSINPSLSVSNGQYSSTVIGISGTTKIDCTLVLYEKNIFGLYSEVSRTSKTYYGGSYTFTGFYNLQSGKTYKLVTQATVTSNGYSEYVEDSEIKKV